jgi:hypothetical protein
MKKPEITRLEEKLPEGKASELRGLNLKELEFEFVKAGQLKEGYITARNNDKDLEEAKEAAKALAAPHSEDIKAAATLHRFIALLLSEKKE